MSVNEYLDKFTLTQKDSNAFWMDWLGHWITSFRAIPFQTLLPC
jgi:hypothetical protein